MSIDKKLIREQFLKMREDENKRIKEEDETKRIAFYKKLGVNKLDMYIEFLFDCHYDEYK